MAKLPHEILGVTKDASINDITIAFNHLAPRCNPERHPGNEIMAQRFKRLREAYEAMVKQRQDEESRKNPPRKTAYNYRPETDYDDFIYPPEQREKPRKSKKQVAEEALAFRVRVGRLLKEWEQYVVSVHNRHKTIDEIKLQRGLTFTYLKHVFRRTDEDQILWAAEDYLRRGHEDALGMHFNYRSLSTIMSDLRYRMRHNELKDINPGMLALAEEDVRYRMIQHRQAIHLLRGMAVGPGIG